MFEKKVTDAEKKRLEKEAKKAEKQRKRSWLQSQIPGKKRYYQL